MEDREVVVAITYDATVQRMASSIRDVLLRMFDSRIAYQIAGCACDLIAREPAYLIQHNESYVFYEPSVA